MSAAAPDAEQHNISVSFGWRQASWTIDGYYNLGIFKKSEVTNTSLSGRYENYLHTFGVSVERAF